MVGATRDSQADSTRRSRHAYRRSFTPGSIPAVPRWAGWQSGGYVVLMDENRWVPPTGSVTMFTTGFCGYCVRLKRQLTDADISFTEVDIEQTPDAAVFVESQNDGNQTVPTVVFPDGSTATNPSLADVASRLA